MARKTSPTLTEAEQRVMRVLWATGAATVRKVFETLRESQDVAYTTVQTIFTILERKNYVTSHKEGRAFVYRALVSKREAQGQALKSLVHRFFDGSPQALAQFMVKDADTDLFVIDDLRRALDQEEEKD